MQKTVRPLLNVPITQKVTITKVVLVKSPPKKSKKLFHSNIFAKMKNRKCVYMR